MWSSECENIRVLDYWWMCRWESVEHFCDSWLRQNNICVEMVSGCVQGYDWSTPEHSDTAVHWGTHIGEVTITRWCHCCVNNVMCHCPLIPACSVSSPPMMERESGDLWCGAPVCGHRSAQGGTMVSGHHVSHPAWSPGHIMQHAAHHHSITILMTAPATGLPCKIVLGHR